MRVPSDLVRGILELVLEEMVNTQDKDVAKAICTVLGCEPHIWDDGFMDTTLFLENWLCESRLPRSWSWCTLGHWTGDPAVSLEHVLKWLRLSIQAPEIPKPIPTAGQMSLF